MNKITRRNSIDIPYSLHDGAVIGFDIIKDKLLMKFQYGFISTMEPFKQIEGKVEFEKIDWDFSYAYIFEYQDVLCGNVGSFIGKKMELSTFISQYKNFKFDIVDETYGYNQSNLTGIFHVMIIWKNVLLKYIT